MSLLWKGFGIGTGKQDSSHWEFVYSDMWETLRTLPNSSFLSVFDACVRQGSRLLQNCLCPLTHEKWWPSMPFYFNGWTPPLQGWTKLSHYNVIITKTEPITVNFWVILSPPWLKEQWRQCHLPKKRNTWELCENAFRTQLQSLAVGRLIL